MPADRRAARADRPGLGLRNQARRLSPHGPQDRERRAHLHPSRRRLDQRFPHIVETVGKLKSKSVLIDGEGIVARPGDGLADFDLLHSRANDELVTLCAFDLLELNGVDVAALPLLKRKDYLRRLLARARGAITLNQHFEGDGAAIFAEACRLGCEGIIAKRLDLPYQSGRSMRWLKIKNPNSPAARRADEGTF